MGMSDWVNRTISNLQEGFDWLKCTTGFHDFEEWSVDPAAECLEARKCRRCGEVQRRSAHNWAAPYVDKRCRKLHKCRRCKLVEQIGTKHRWSEWEFSKASKCHLVRTCDRCCEKEQKDEHLWGVWQHVSPTSCDQVRFCRRCDEGKEEKVATDEDHQWDRWQRHRDGTEERRCRHCGEVEER